MYSHLLAGTRGPGKLGRDLSTIAEQADRCKKIVAGLLHFARQNKVLRQSVKMIDVVQSCLKGYTVPENIRWEIRDRMQNPIVDIDRDQITQVILNLVNNACDAMGDREGLLTLTLTDKENQACIEVQDTGPGIPDEIVKKIFEPFFTTKSIGKGTGLGLSITYGIVKMHSGDISSKQLRSRQGTDRTTFRWSCRGMNTGDIVQRACKHRQWRQEPWLTPKRHRNKKTILLVDDDRIFCSASKPSLARRDSMCSRHPPAGCRGRSRLKHRPDLCVLDLAMERADMGFTPA